MKLDETFVQGYVIVPIALVLFWLNGTQLAAFAGLITTAAHVQVVQVAEETLRLFGRDMRSSLDAALACTAAGQAL